MPRPDLSIVIVNYAGGSNLSDCLDSLAPLATDPRFEIVVVDNGSPPGTADLSPVGRIAGRFLVLPDNPGYGAACNAGAGVAQGRYLLFLNNDVRVDPRTVRAMLDFVLIRPDLGIGTLGCVLTGADGMPVHSAGSFPGPGTRIRVWSNRLCGNRMERRGLEAFLRSGKEYRFVDYVTGAALLAPSDLFSAAGGFDERFFLYFEDTELQHRLAARGYRAVLLARTGIVHLESGGGKRSNAARIAAYRSLLLYRLVVRGKRGFGLYRIVYAFMVLCHVFNPFFGTTENIAFIRACLCTPVPGEPARIEGHGSRT